MPAFRICDDGSVRIDGGAVPRLMVCYMVFGTMSDRALQPLLQPRRLFRTPSSAASQPGNRRW